MLVPPEMLRKWSLTDLVGLERIAQDDKWGEQNHTPAEWMPILMEEVGELAQEVNRLTFESLDPIARANAGENLCAVAIVECALRNAWGE